MSRPALAVFVACATAVAAAHSCAPAAPKPLDVASHPSASTSAEPLYITNVPLPHAVTQASAPPVVSAMPAAPSTSELAAPPKASSAPARDGGQ